MPSVDFLCWILAFTAFCIVQSFVINGVHYCFQGGCISEMNKGKICKGNVFYKINPNFFEKNKGKWWTMPLWSCVRCMSSVHSIWTYWPVVLLLFGFEYWQLYVWVIDVFVLVSLNYMVYKRL